MAADIKKYAVVLNGFIHDFATGYWLSAMIAIVLLHRFQGKFPAVSQILGGIERFFFWNSVAAVVVIFATGGVRTFTYVDNFFGPETEAARRRMLMGKHVLLIALFAAGGWCAYTMAFHL